MSYLHEELKSALAAGKRLCLGHACIGAYSCFDVATEALDKNGDGYCGIHAEFLRTQLPHSAICPICNEIVWSEEQTENGPERVGRWRCMDPSCYRCGGTGIDPVCIEGGE